MNWLEKIIILQKLNGLIEQVQNGGGVMKSGILTSEFWFGLIGVILNYVGGKFGLDPAITAKVTALIIAYIGSRTIIKSVAATQPTTNTGGGIK